MQGRRVRHRESSCATCQDRSTTTETPCRGTAGEPVPDSVIDVTVPLDVTATSPTGTDNPTTARRVIVNVNGAPGVDGIDRSSSVNFTAGGTSFETLAPTTYDGPAVPPGQQWLWRPGHAGRRQVRVDRWRTSAMCAPGSAASSRRSRARRRNLQIVTFSSQATTLGTSGWNKFYDLANPADVDRIDRADLGPVW